MRYKVVLSYCDPKLRKITLYRGLTLDQAQDICADNESSYKTCTKKYLKRRTREKGMWFLIYFKDE